MQAQSHLSYTTSSLFTFKSYIEEHARPVEVNNEEKYIVFLSIGNEDSRAKVLCEVNQSKQKVYQNLEKKVTQYVKRHHFNPQWLKLDLVTSVEAKPFQTFEKEIAETRKNYFRYGVSFDTDFQLAFLEQEINGNALIRAVKNQKPSWHDKNTNHYLKYRNNNAGLFMKHQYANKDIYLFQTQGFFKDRQEETIHELYNGQLTNGLRKLDDMKVEVRQLIEKSTSFLTDQVKGSGQFEYGYFSAFAKRINTYNILRHSSSLYAMMEGYELIKDDRIVQAVERGLTYLIDQAIVYKTTEEEGIAFVVDHANEGEIKLGSNATAILAMAKYMEVTGDRRYLQTAQDLARGILEMKLPDSSFIHVLSYPTFGIKEMNRIIYYEGEAIFALLRLYAIDKENRWLAAVKDSFDYFIANNYWKHHDHWLSYAANELVMYDPADKYFIFGMKNCNQRLNFIYHRETTFPTFLELTMAAYKMVERMKKLGKEELLKYIDESFLVETIDRRAEFQRVGFFYPEQAMYMKDPGLILHGFFIRHHSLRVRIDDVEHYLSGYCQYYQDKLLNEVKKQPVLLDI